MYWTVKNSAQKPFQTQKSIPVPTMAQICRTKHIASVTVATVTVHCDIVLLWYILFR